MKIIRKAKKVILEHDDIFVEGEIDENGLYNFQTQDSFDAKTFEALLYPINDIYYNHIPDNLNIVFYLPLEFYELTDIPFDYLYFFKKGNDFHVRLAGLGKVFVMVKRWNYNFFVEAFEKIANENYEGAFEIDKSDNVIHEIRFTMVFDDADTIENAVNITLDCLKDLVNKTVAKIEGFQWKDEYQKNASIFSVEVLHPLLKKIKFDNIQYIQGMDKHGRAFVFSETNKLGNAVYYALQANAGDIREDADSSTIAQQIKAAFEMPFKALGSKQEKYISFLIVATSGVLSQTAKQNILNQLPTTYKRYIFFWDKEVISDLIHQLWKM